MTDSEGAERGEPPPYIIFVVVLLFFMTGLFGFLVCHLLKKKGYSCRAGDVEGENEEEKLGGEPEDENEDNQDTVEQILKCILQNEANMEAFQEMLGTHNVCERHDPRPRKESISGIPPHHHTVHSGANQNSCLLCAQVRSKKGRRPSRAARFRQRPGEQTVFSVGRFRVIHTDRKLPGAASTDNLDQSQVGEERKGGEFNLRNMFKDVSSEGLNGGGASVGKRKKSVSLFGVRRGSDPIGIKVKEGLGREAGGIRFVVQQPPPVVEESLQTENEADPQPAPNVQTEPQQTRFRLSPSPELETNPLCGGSVTPALASLAGKTVNVDDKVLKIDELSKLGPQQTSTPISPMPVSCSAIAPGFGLSEPFSTKRFPVTQTPPDPSSSPNLEPGFGTGLTLISLGSSPPLSLPDQTLSSASSLKTLTLSPAESPSPKSSSRNKSSEGIKAAQTSSQNPLSPAPDSTLSLEQGSNQAHVLDPTAKLLTPQTSSSSLAKHNNSFASSSTCPPGSENISKEDATLSILSIKTETEKKAGMLKTTETEDAQVFPPASEQLSKDRISSIAPASSSPQSPREDRFSSVTIVRAGPESTREFSVVTMVEAETKNRPLEESPAKGDICPPGIGLLEGSGGEGMMEMDDIGDCNVERGDKTKTLEEEIIYTGSL